MEYSREYYIGEEALQLRGVLKLAYPMERGIITDFSAIEKMIHYSFYTDMRIDPAEHSVIFLYNPLLHRKAQEKLIEILFETFNIPALFFVDYYRFILLQNKIQNAIFLHFLDDCINIIPYLNYKRIDIDNPTINLGFRDVVEHLRRLLRKKGHRFTTSSERKIVRDIVEKFAYVALDPEKELTSRKESKRYVLPDGELLLLDNELFLAPELYFNPSVIGKEIEPLNILLKNLLEDEPLKDFIEKDGSLLWLGETPHMENFIERTIQMMAPIEIKPSQNILLNYVDIYDKIYHLNLTETDLFKNFINRSLYMVAGPSFLLDLIYENEEEV